MVGVIKKIYVRLLWIAGAALTDQELEELKGGGDRITYWFRRSKKRLGAWWWVAVIATLIIANFKLYTSIKNKSWGWVTATMFFDGLCIWLIPHILGCW